MFGLFKNIEKENKRCHKEFLNLALRQIKYKRVDFGETDALEKYKREAAEPLLEWIDSLPTELRELIYEFGEGSVMTSLRVIGPLASPQSIRQLIEWEIQQTEQQKTGRPYTSF
jgi:hypothetical protein